jgi:hypothetical protein
MLVDLIKQTVQQAGSTLTLTPTRENFGSDGTVKYIALLVTVLLWLLLILLVAKYLWNEVLCHMVTFAKPTKSVFHLLGLVVLLNILAPTTH